MAGGDDDSSSGAEQSSGGSDSLTVDASDLIALLIISSIASITIVLGAQRIWSNTSEKKDEKIVESSDSEENMEVEV